MAPARRRRCGRYRASSDRTRDARGSQGTTSVRGEPPRGTRQKVLIPGGLVRDATTLLFDEPLTGLDPVGIHRMRETIVARGLAGATVLVSSHLLHMVEEICTRVIIMDHGRKVADGTVAELASRSELA